MSASKTADRIIREELGGRQKLHAVLKAKGYTYQSYAQYRSLWPEQVKHTVYGIRPNPEIRQMFSEDLGIPRSEIDRLIDGA